MSTNRVSNLTIEEFRKLIRETVWETLLEFADVADPDAGSKFRPEIAERLRVFLKERPQGRPLEDIVREAYDE